MLPRRLETEAMDTAEEARDYDTMDHSAVNRVFVDDFLAFLGERGLQTDGKPIRVLDVGTGTAQIPLELCTRDLPVRITASDLAGQMLQLAMRNVVRAGRTASIKLDQVDAKAMPYAGGEFDAVMSNSIIHHIPEPLFALKEMVRVLKPGGALFVRDLFRPRDLDELSRIVDTYAAGENDHQRQMFGDSLHAALTIPEVQDLLDQTGLPRDCVHPTSDRHWTIAVWKQ